MGKGKAAEYHHAPRGHHPTSFAGAMNATCCCYLSTVNEYGSIV